MQPKKVLWRLLCGALSDSGGIRNEKTKEHKIAVYVPTYYCTFLSGLSLSVFSCFGKNFLTKNSMVSLLESVYYIICLAFGMTFVISTGGIDLSIGSVAMCGALIGGVSYNEWHMPIWAALIITVLVTTVFGVLNGFLVSCCKIPPFVATMGTQYLAQGIGYIVSRVQTMRYPVVTSPDGWFKRVFYKSLNGFPMGVIYMVILFVIASFICRI